jgi:hypothetical protein
MINGRNSLAALHLLLVPSFVAAQQTAPVAEAFRERVREVGQNFVLAADAMPADKYSFRVTQRQLRVAEIVGNFSRSHDYFCAVIRGVAPPKRPPLADTANKAALVARLREAVRSCDQTLADLDDTNLGSPNSSDDTWTRAKSTIAASAIWADLYGQLATDLRLNGLVPPVPCTGDDPMNKPGCSSGREICKESTSGDGGPASLTLSDAPYAVISDGLGPYRNRGQGNVWVFAARPAVLMFGPPSGSGPQARSIRVDLNHPVPSDIGVPLGVVTDNRSLEMAAQWYTDSTTNLAHSILDIPIGATVFAEQTDVGFHLDGAYHVLQMGPMRYGHCLSDGSALDGAGTTRATIHRTTEHEWVVDLPPGSIGRLFDVHLRAPNAINKGLYYVSLHYVVNK